MTEPLVFTLVAAPILLGIVQALKQAGALAPPRDGYASLVSLTLGAVGGGVWQTWVDVFTTSVGSAVVYGIVAGLTASGLYSGTKSTVETVGR